MVGKSNLALMKRDSESLFPFRGVSHPMMATVSFRARVSLIIHFYSTNTFVNMNEGIEPAMKATPIHKNKFPLDIHRDAVF